MEIAEMILLYIACSFAIMVILFVVINMLNRKINTAIKKADFVEKKLLEYKYR